jgi:cysteine desulfurase / selenocysteine lyase
MNTPFDIAAVRAEFPVTKRMLYLDSAHQSPLAGSVRDALLEFYGEGHEAGGPKPLWLQRVEQTRGAVAKFVNAKPSEIAFTKNTSEGLNIAANAVPLEAGDNVLLIEGDHPNNAYAWLNLKRKGVEIRFVPLNCEVATAATFEPYVDARTRVITLSHVTFHAGHRHDIANIGAFCKKHGLYLVVDAMQSAGVVPIDVKQMGISILAAGCHKGLLVPQGLGILYVKEGLDELQPVYLAMAGVANPPADYIARPDDLALRKDAGRFELGNLNLPDIHALSASVALIEQVGIENVERHVLDLGDHLIEQLDKEGIRLVGPRGRSHRAHIYVLDLPAADWVEYLAKNHVRVSPERDGVRISFALFNTREEVDQLMTIIRRRKTSQSGHDTGQAIEQLLQSTTPITSQE